MVGATLREIGPDVQSGNVANLLLILISIIEHEREHEHEHEHEHEQAKLCFGCAERK